MYFNNYEAKSSKLDSGGNEISIGEIPKPKLKNTLYEVVEQLSPTTYELKDPESGKHKARPAHVSQIARVRFPAVQLKDGTHLAGEPQSTTNTSAATRKPYIDQPQSQLWRQLKRHSYVLYHDKDDPMAELPVGEVMEIEHKGGDDERLVVWAAIHGERTSKYKATMPLKDRRISPEYIDSRGKSWVKPKATQMKDMEMSLWRYAMEDITIVVPAFTKETGGKIPKRVCDYSDKWLRRRIREGHGRCSEALSTPNSKQLSSKT